MNPEPMRDPIVYRPADRPEVEVLVDGTWYSGEVRMWTNRDGTWYADVGWSSGPAENRIRTFSADQLRRLP
jgi:hypothetical protein